MLDYGCGLGRLALPFAQLLRGGGYVGIDTHRPSIEHCRRAFRDYRNFEFLHVDLHSRMYNERGGSFDQLGALKLDARFDVAFLLSVFTHVLPENFNSLTEFLYRSLKPGGTLLASFFLLNETSLGHIAQGKTKWKFAFEHNGARVNNSMVPEGAVAYPQNDVLRRLTQAGFREPYVSHGHWGGARPVLMHGQDYIVCDKPV